MNSAWNLPSGKSKKTNHYMACLAMIKTSDSETQLCCIAADTDAARLRSRSEPDNTRPAPQRMTSGSWSTWRPPASLLDHSRGKDQKNIVDQQNCCHIIANVMLTRSISIDCNNLGICFYLVVVSSLPDSYRIMSGQDRSYMYLSF